MRCLRLSVWFIFLLWPIFLAGSNDGVERQVVVLEIDGAIGPATSDYVSRGLDKARAMDAELVVLRMDTPGGLDTAMREIIQDIIASAVPVASYVAPGGARAASAGTYILYASHVAAMAPATNLGAATPVQIGGSNPLPGRPGSPDGDATDEAREKLRDWLDTDSVQGSDNQSREPDTEEQAVAPRDESGSDAMAAKQINDAVAYIRGLAKMRGRNADWAERAVREAASLPVDEAVALNVVDLVADDLAMLLEAVHGRTVSLQGLDRKLDTRDVTVTLIEPDWRNRLLSLITDPNVAYILMMIGIYGLFFELSNPGFILPGVLGAICLLLALYAFQVLPVNYAGVALVILGIAFMVAEAFMPSFGVLGIGGVAAFVFGSVILIDTDVESFQIMWSTIATVAALSLLFFSALIAMVFKARRRHVVSGAEEMIDSEGEALVTFDVNGRVRVHSEAWNAHTSAPLAAGQKVIVTGIDGLTLEVKPKD